MTHITLKNIKTRIIAAILAFAIAITGISLDAATAHAETLDQFTPNTTITMKPGDTKRLLATGKDGSDWVPKYKWSSSDKSVVKVNTDFVDPTVDYTECVEIIALKTGTVTVTAARRDGLNTVTMTVTVEEPKATAKQKACKHSFKTTRKATCEREGVKTCKKCKFQKVIKKKAHAYVKKNVSITAHEVYTIRDCHCGKQFYSEPVMVMEGTEPFHDAAFCAAYDKMVAEFVEHNREQLQLTGELHGFSECEYLTGKAMTVGTKTVMICKNCGAEKE